MVRRRQMYCINELPLVTSPWTHFHKCVLQGSSLQSGATKRGHVLFKNTLYGTFRSYYICNKGLLWFVSFHINLFALCVFYGFFRNVHRCNSQSYCRIIVEIIVWCSVGLTRLTRCLEPVVLHGLWPANMSRTGNPCLRVVPTYHLKDLTRALPGKLRHHLFLLCGSTSIHIDACRGQIELVLIWSRSRSFPLTSYEHQD